MNNPTLYVMIGPAGSGKTTFAKNIPWACRVSPDNVRKEWFGDEACQKDHGKVFELAYKSTENLLCAVFDVVFDATNTTPAARKKLLQRMEGICHKNVAVYMNTPLMECKRRNAQRDRVVSNEVIDRQYEQMIRDAQSIPAEFDEIAIVHGWRK